MSNPLNPDGEEYTPATENVEHSYVAYRSSKVDLVTGHHEFTRWLETVRAEAKAEALEEAINALMAGPEANLNPDGTMRPPHLHRSPILKRNPRLRVANWLLRQANQYKEEQ